MKILVTGATGFIGQRLTNTFLDKNFQIIAILRESSESSKINRNIEIFSYNENINNLISFFKKENFDGIIHLATHFVATHATEDIPKLIASNIKFGTEVLEATVQSQVKWFINVGTFWQNYCCDGYNPVNLYAATKEAFQTIAKYYTETSDLIFTTVKLNDTFGPNDNRKKLINLWNKISVTGESVDFPNGEQLMDICYIDDVVNAFNVLISHLSSKGCMRFKNKIFAISSNERVTLKELAMIYEKTTKRKLNINWGSAPYREREVMVPWDKGKRIPGWKPKYTLEMGFKKLKKYIKL